MPSRTRREGSIIIKSFTERIRLEREVAVLQFLQSTDLRILIPEVLEVNTDSLSFRMTVIGGQEMTKESAGHKVVRRLGEVFALIHGMRSFSACGTFNASPKTDEKNQSFSDFLSAQLERWHMRVIEFSSGYEDEIKTLREAISGRESELDSLGLPRFCHNDFDLKNVMVQDANVAGIVDWEFAGSYPLVWELRKMTASLFWERPELWMAFMEGYSASDPLAIIPKPDDLTILTGVDCIGALGWAYRESDMMKIATVQHILRQSIQKLS